MIAPNDRTGRATQGVTPTGAVTPARAPLAAQESTPPAVTWEVVMLHSADDFDRHVLPRGATPYEVTDRLVCPCNDGPSMCPECRKESDELKTLNRLRKLRESEDIATDGEPRDGGDDLC